MPDHCNLRCPCTKCGSTNGTATDKTGQRVIRCATCLTYAYNEPKTESGATSRNISRAPSNLHGGTGSSKRSGMPALRVASKTRTCISGT